MIDRRRLGQHGTSLALVFAWLFVALSVVGYDPLDPPSTAEWTAGPRDVRNPCGPVGAHLAWGLFQAVGWASIAVLWGLGVAALVVVRRKLIPDIGLRVAGFGGAVLVAAAVLAACDARRGAPLFGRGPVVGTGGYAGALVAGFLSEQFGPLGMLLILTGLGVASGAVCQDVFLGWPLREALAWRGRFASGRRAGPAPAPLGLAGAPLDYRPLPAPAYGETWAPAVEPAPRRAQPALPPARRPRAAGPVPAAPADGRYAPPPFELLEPGIASPLQDAESLIQQRATVLEKTLREHGCVVRVVQIDTGPVITMFEIELEAGLRVSKVLGLSNDLAIALAVPSVRIVYPLPGRTTVGVEVPNERRAVVKLSEVMAETHGDTADMMIPLFLGKDVKGNSLSYDLAKMPHLLIAGRTGTGKSVSLNAIILSIVMTRRPDEVKLILIDPKKVELSQFRRVPHLMHPVVTEMEKVETLLSWACDAMDERYSLLERARVRSIRDYNALGAEGLRTRLRVEDDAELDDIPTYLHSIVIVVDELADMVQSSTKEVETHLIRLAQKARAAGIHLILATQRPTVDVVTGLIKTNMPGRIAFQVTSRNDSRIVLDEMGAEKLLGNGDMLFLKPNTSDLIRAQGTYVSDDEVNRVCAYLEQFPLEFSKDLVKLKVAGGKDKGGLKDRDDMYEAAIEVVIREGRGSCSLLQRALGIGYGRAARLIDFMAEDGIVGPYKSGSFREVLYSWEDWESLRDGGDASESAA